MKELGDALANVIKSKTYVLLILILEISFFSVLLAEVGFDRDEWDKFFDVAVACVIAAVVRAVFVDALPQLIVAWKGLPPTPPAVAGPPSVNQSAPTFIPGESEPITAIKSFPAVQPTVEESPLPQVDDEEPEVRPFIPHVYLEGIQAPGQSAPPSNS